MPVLQPPEGGTIHLQWWYDDYKMQGQQVVPQCAPPPPACTLGWDIGNPTVVIDVTIRGDDDGSIQVYWTGSTGTTTCYINGTSDGTEAGNTHTYTGLQAGYYNLRIEEGQCFAQEENVQVLDGEFRTGAFNVNLPADLCAVENPIILNLKTAQASAAPQPSKGDIDVDGVVSDGDSLTFTFTYPQAYTAVFYAKNFPNRDNYFLASVLKDAQGVSVGANTAAEIATSILEVLEKDSVISRLYYLRVSSNIVYLQAKENNTLLDINTVITENSLHLDVTSNQQGVSAFDGQLSQDYSLYANILVNTDVQYGEDPAIDTFNKASQLVLPFNPNTNNHKFDLSEVLKNFVSTPKIDFALTGYTTISKMLAGYRVDYGEQYPLVPNSSTKKSRSKGTTDTQYVLNSALPWEDENDMTDYLGHRLHNVRANFSGYVLAATPSPTEVRIGITTYLWDVAETGTTDIKFRYTETVQAPDYDSGWVTGTTHDVTGVNFYGTGRIYISGQTEGVTFQYSRSWYALQYYGNSAIGAANPDPNIQHEVKFLTNSPNPKFVQRDSSEFLYLPLSKNYGKDLKIIADLYFYDGSELLAQDLYTVATGGTNYGGIFCFAAGYNELNLAQYETYSGGTRKIRRVDFALYQYDVTNGDYLLSEEKSYRYEIDEQPRRYGVAFLNKLGTYDIFDFAGEIVNSVTHSNESYEVPRALNLQGASPYGFQANTVYNTKVTKTIAANTGWIDLEHFNWLLELLESNRCYNYTQTDQSFLVVKSVGYSESSNDDLYQIDVTFVETLYQNNISV